MKSFWNDRGSGVASDAPIEVTLERAGIIWSDELRGVEGNFFGLVDDHGNTIQFYFTEGIPDHVEDAHHLRIVLMDFPRADEKGSYGRVVAIGEVHSLIERAFAVGADFRNYGALEFSPW